MNSHILEIVPALDAVEVRATRGCGFVCGIYPTVWKTMDHDNLAGSILG